MVPYMEYLRYAQKSRTTCTSSTSGDHLSLPLPKKKQKFDRIMKMRNTDERLTEYSTWKPVQMYNGRDNIGVRNYKKTQ